MNDKDKEAYAIYEKTILQREGYLYIAREAWQAACEYARDEFKFQTPPAVIAYQEMNDKLQAKNAKLEKCLRLFAFPEGTLEHEAVERAARQVLKELDEE